MPRDDGSAQRIYRCPDCQVAVFSEYGRPGSASSASARSTIPSAVAPDVHIYTRSKLPWVVLPDGVPAFDVYYDTKSLWPPESYARARAALARGSSEG